MSALIPEISHACQKLALAHSHRGAAFAWCLVASSVSSVHAGVHSAELQLLSMRLWTASRMQGCHSAPLVACKFLPPGKACCSSALFVCTQTGKESNAQPAMHAPPILDRHALSPMASASTLDVADRAYEGVPADACSSAARNAEHAGDHSAI